MSNFREFDRETRFLLPPSLDEWLPEQHLARFVVEVIDGLDLSAMVKSYRGTGSAGYHPVLLLGLLVYGYATGVFSSRKLERATYDLVAFRFIAVNQHPDHDTIATFRRRFLKDIEALFVRVLELAREMGLVKLGTVALGRRWLFEIVAGATIVEQIAAREGCSIHQVNMTISLAFLAPRLVQAARHAGYEPL